MSSSQKELNWQKTDANNQYIRISVIDIVSAHMYMRATFMISYYTHIVFICCIDL